MINHITTFLHRRRLRKLAMRRADTDGRDRKATDLSISLPVSKRNNRKARGVSSFTIVAR